MCECRDTYHPPPSNSAAAQDVNLLYEEKESYRAFIKPWSTIGRMFIEYQYMYKPICIYDISMIYTYIWTGGGAG